MASIVPVEKKTLDEKLKILDKIASSTNKKYGKTIMGRIGKDKEIMDKLAIKFIPTPSSSINRDTGGGIPRARFTIITGNPDSGKTSLLLNTISENMEKDPDFTAGWLESEASLEKNYICETFKIDPERFFYIPLDLDVGTEKTLDIVEGILGTGAVDMFCINSLRCLVPDKERGKSLAETTVAEQARMNAKIMRKWTSIVAQYDTAFVAVQHLTTSIGGYSYGDSKVLAGGEAMKYWAALILQLSKHAIKDSDPITKDEGMKIGYIVKKNHCTPGAKRQYAKGEYFVAFGEGIEEIAPSINWGIESGILVRHGAWLYWMDGDKEKEKFASRAAFREAMKKDPQKWAEYYALVSGSAPTSDLTDEEIEAIEAENDKINKAGSESEKLAAEIEKEPVTA